MKKTNQLLGLLFGLGFSLLAGAQDYDVSVRGMSAGKANLTMTSDGKSYQTTLKLFPNLIAKMAGVGNWVDSSQGKIVKGHFQPVHYQRTDGNQRLLSVKFMGKKAQVNNEDGKKTLRIHRLGQDPMSQIAQIQYDLKKGKRLADYYLVTDKNQRLYHSQLLKKGQNTQVSLIQEKGGERTITLWFDNHQQLLRMKKTKRGKTDFDMVRR